MNAKRIIMLGTMAATISLGGGVWCDKASASASGRPAAQIQQEKAKDAFHEALGTTSDDEIYQSLYNGRSLAAIAGDNRQDAGQIVDLQVSELAEMLDARLASGALSQRQYDGIKSELREIVTRSVYGESLQSAR